MEAWITTWVSIGNSSMFFSKASPETLAPSQAPYLLTKTEFSLTIPIHSFHRASELETALKQGSFQLPTPHSIAGFAGEVILLLKSFDGCLLLLGHISKSSVKACMIWLCLLLQAWLWSSAASQYAPVTLTFSSLSTLPLLSPFPR